MGVLTPHGAIRLTRTFISSCARARRARNRPRVPNLDVVYVVLCVSSRYAASEEMKIRDFVVVVVVVVDDADDADADGGGENSRK